jgi:hypothetical protein
MDEIRFENGSTLSICTKENPQHPTLPADGIARVTASTTRSITRWRVPTRSRTQDLSARALECSLRRRQRTVQARLSASPSTQFSGRSPVRPRLDRAGPEFQAWLWCAVGNARAFNCRRRGFALPRANIVILLESRVDHVLKLYARVDMFDQM